MKYVYVCRHELTLLPESARVIVRPFIPSSSAHIQTIIGRVLALSEKEVQCEWEAVREEFSDRHHDIEKCLLANFSIAEPYLEAGKPLSRQARLLLGAAFSGEYALESAALFNPSIVPHPNQHGVPAGALRFIMSLRATGEGHISSIEFRSGLITADSVPILDPVSRFVTMPEVVLDPTYRKANFATKLNEMGFGAEQIDPVLASLGPRFTRRDLEQSVARVRASLQEVTHIMERSFECIQWLADSNYQLRFPPRLSMSERIIFPVSDNESNGIEDARFVRFTEEDGTVMYYATYTAYNGRTILPQLIETTDFEHFNVLTLNGKGVQNKGMALFPRRINGRYAMLSRQDDENILIMFSDNVHFWNDSQLLLRPAELWESVKVGNCGSPIETEAGWLVITHGVGPMRKYCIGAVLLDLEDPTKVIGRLAIPLLSAAGSEREGYVPNVVYSCGSLVHGRDLILPYAMSDKATAIATVPLDALITSLLSMPPKS